MTTNGSIEVKRALDGFTALNPTDGLFLRAEHLATLQGYAQSLVKATATAVGPGIVHGLGVRLGDDGAHLTVSPGLAITPHGQLLALSTSLEVPFDAQHLPPLAQTNGFWRIELHFASELSGSEPVYGSLCDQPCGDDAGATVHPWRVEGVELRLVPDTIDGLSGADSDVRRNFLASAYFERERTSVPPWLMPTTNAGQVDALTGRPWDDGTALPPDAGVPLGVLQDVDGTRLLDMWTARRLVDGSAAQATWRGRLGMRPWSVFLAQVLQFESEYADAGSPLGRVGADPDQVIIVEAEVDEQLRQPVEDFIQQMHVRRNPVANSQLFKELESAAHEARTQRVRLKAASSLMGLGILELPPAGYLEVDEKREDLMDFLAEYFGGGVELRRCDVRADEVAQAVVRAQDRDRIPLVPAYDVHPQVDVLVPVHQADKRELYTPSYGWVAFARRPPSCVTEVKPPKPDLVTVYVAEVGDNKKHPELQFAEGDLDKAEKIGRLEYPPGGWDYPGPKIAAEAVTRIDDEDLAVVVALTASEERMPLNALRASLFVASMDAGLKGIPVYAYAPQHGPEAIVLVISRPDNE